MSSYAELLAVLDARPTGNGNYSAHCPVPSHGKGQGDRNGSLSIGLGDIGVLLHCHARCPFDDIVTALERRGIDWPVDTDASLARQAIIDRAAAAEGLPPGLLEFDCKLIIGKDRETDHYLQARGLDIDDLQDIQHHPNALHALTDTYWPCMVCAVRDVDNNLRGLHRTFLSRDNPPTKAPVEKPRLFYKGGRYAGNAIHLAPAAEVMLLGEGLESTASAMKIFGLPGWAAGSCGFLPLVQLPDIVEEVVIAADNDRAGLDAAIAAAQRFRREGRRARIVKPSICKDYNDLLLLRRGLPEPAGLQAAGGQRR